MLNGARWTVVAAGMVVGRAVVVSAQIPTAGIREALVRELTLSAADLDAVARGDVVAKTLPTRDARDVAVIALARVDRRVRPSLAIPRGTLHRFGRPASLADVQDVRVTPDDIEELRKCQPSACNFKLPASDMQAVRAVIDSAGSDAADRVTAYVQQRMVDYVNAYRQQGSAAMVVYEDLGSVRSSAAFDEMMQDSSRMFRIVPALASYMNGFPRDSLAGATSEILWTVDVLPRLRPVMRIMQRVVYDPPDDPTTSFIVSKQLYADHYFEAGLEALLFTDAANLGFERTGADAVIVETRRYRFDHLPSGGLFNLRRRVVNALRDNVADDVKRLRGDR
jgi:hypothetical protein